MIAEVDFEAGEEHHEEEPELGEQIEELGPVDPAEDGADEYPEEELEHDGGRAEVPGEQRQKEGGTR